MARKKIISTADTNSTVVKNAGGRVLGYSLSNTHATEYRYFKLYDLPTTPSQSSTVIDVIAIPPNTNITVDLVRPVLYSAGISYRIVKGSADNDNTAVAAGDVVGSLTYA